MRMKTIRGIEFYTGSREEALPDFTTKFPYIATSAELDRYEGRFVPWHWHQAIELFFMDMGGLEYHTPKGKYLFPEGTGGMVNSNVLHMTKPKGSPVWAFSRFTRYTFQVSLMAIRTFHKVKVVVRAFVRIL